MRCLDCDQENDIFPLDTYIKVPGKCPKCVKNHTEKLVSEIFAKKITKK